MFLFQLGGSTLAGEHPRCFLMINKGRWLLIVVWCGVWVQSRLQVTCSIGMHFGERLILLGPRWVGKRPWWPCFHSLKRRLLDSKKCVPRKFRIDTKNRHNLKGDNFPSHHLGYFGYPCEFSAAAKTLWGKVSHSEVIWTGNPIRFDWALTKTQVI